MVFDLGCDVALSLDRDLSGSGEEQFEPRSVHLAAEQPVDDVDYQA